jgi:hypothetical protein
MTLTTKIQRKFAKTSAFFVWFLAISACVFAAEPPKSSALSAIRPQIERRVSELRGLDFLRPVTYRTIARDKLHDFLLEKLRKQYTDEELRNYGRGLAALGAIPDGTDVKGVMLAMYGEQLAAFYDMDVRALYTFREQTFPQSIFEMFLAHELVHALQDQHFNLQKLPLRQKHNDDRALAALALAEGDATWVMTRFFFENMAGADATADMEQLLNFPAEALMKAPAFFREQMLFPYLYGQEFCRVLLATGGTEALNAALRNPPSSTTHIMHPEKFIADRAEPADFTIAEPKFKAPHTKIADNVFGEFGTFLLLKQHISHSQATAATAGWRGDRYHVFESSRGGGVLKWIWVSEWETEKDAKEFADAARAMLEKRDLLEKSRIEVDKVRVTVAHGL